MFRHVFIGTFKDGVDDATKAAELAALKADFDGFIAHPYHMQDLLKLGTENFAGYVSAQFEL